MSIWIFPWRAGKLKCNCCDKDMSDKETIFNEELGTWELCTVCLDAAFDAAFSQGFSRDDEDDKFVILDDDYDYPEEVRREPVYD